MLGASARTNAQVSVPGGQGSVAANVAAGTASARAGQIYQSQQDNGSVGAIPFVLLGLVALYVIWAIVIQHERIRESLQPANVAVNLHNVVNITLMALIGLLSGKILFTKLTAWNVPGASWLGQLFAAA